MFRLTKRQQRERISSLAPQLARTGRFSGWKEIETHLRFQEGLPEARHALDERFTRQELDRLCLEARKDA